MTRLRSPPSISCSARSTAIRAGMVSASGECVGAFEEVSRGCGVAALRGALSGGVQVSGGALAISGSDPRRSSRSFRWVCSRCQPAISSSSGRSWPRVSSQSANRSCSSARVALGTPRRWRPGSVGVGSEMRCRPGAPAGVGGSAPCGPGRRAPLQFGVRASLGRAADGHGGETPPPRSLHAPAAPAPQSQPLQSRRQQRQNRRGLATGLCSRASAAISSRNSGLPSLAAITRARGVRLQTFAELVEQPLALGCRRAARAAPSPALTFPPPHAGRSSSSSGRATHSRGSELRARAPRHGRGGQAALVRPTADHRCARSPAVPRRPTRAPGAPPRTAPRGGGPARGESLQNRAASSPICVSASRAARR